MGTHRSRHNKGRKPFYKEIDRTTLADLAPVEMNGWQSEAEQFFENRRLNVFREARYQAPSRPAWVRKADPELLPAVERYLRVRREVDARKAADAVFPKQRGPEFDLITAPEQREIVDRVQPSERDVLMQLFSDRKITAGQLHAGRKWQRYRELATIQPSMSIGWHQALRNMPYQRRGDLSDSQSAAMAYRREFYAYAGAAAVTFLDFCLDADRGRDELLRVLKIDRDQLAKGFDDMLFKLCTCFGRERRGVA